MSDQLNRLRSHINEQLDPALKPLGFAKAQGPNEASHGRAQFIFCRGFIDSVEDACVDLVIDFSAEQGGEFKVDDVRYWGFDSDRWHIDFDRNGNYEHQIQDLADRLPDILS